MGQGIYIVRGIVPDVTVATNLLYLQAPSNGICIIIEAFIKPIDDLTDEMMYAALTRASGTVGGGDAITPKPVAEKSAAFDGAAKLATTAITGLTPDNENNAMCYQVNKKRVGFSYRPSSGERGILAPSDQLLLRTDATLTEVDLLAQITFEVLG